MKFLFSIAFLLVLVLAKPISAQQVVPPLKREFLDSNFVVVASAADARYRRETEYKDSVGGELRDYFLSGRLQSSLTYEHFKKGIAHGTFQSWYESGQPEWHQEFAHGQQIGEALHYYRNGQVKRRESYMAGKRIAGKCYNVQGQELPYFEYQVMPTFPGGVEALIQLIGRSTIYPREAIERNLQGKVMVQFVVDTVGIVRNPNITQSVDLLLDAEAVRVVLSLPRFTPGRLDGRLVPVAYTVPITFVLKEPLLQRRRRVDE